MLNVPSLITLSATPSPLWLRLFSGDIAFKARGGFIERGGLKGLAAGGAAHGRLAHHRQ